MDGRCDDDDGSSCMLRKGTEMKDSLDDSKSDEQNSSSLLRRGIKFSSVEEFLNFLNEGEVKDKPVEVHKLGCGLCSKKYSTKSHVKRHILTAHLEEVDCENIEKYIISGQQRDLKEEFDCEQGSKKFSRKEDLKVHLKLHQKEAKVPMDKLAEVQKSGRPECGICGKKYSTRSYVKRHILTAHQEEVDRENIEKFVLPKQQGKSWKDKLAEVHKSGWPGCGLCGKKYHNRSYVKKHILTAHLGEVDGENIGKFILPGQQGNAKEFECEQCGKKCNRKDNLKKHLRVHQKDSNERFECEQCSKKFSWKENLRKHLRVHQEEFNEELECKQCSKKFSGKEHLKRHMLMHMRRFQCDHCDENFGSRENLAAHKAEHHREFKCDEQGCDFKAQTEADLLKHMNQHYLESGQLWLIKRYIM